MRFSIHALTDLLHLQSQESAEQEEVEQQQDTRLSVWLQHFQPFLQDLKLLLAAHAAVQQQPDLPSFGPAAPYLLPFVRSELLSCCESAGEREMEAVISLLQRLALPEVE